jgi:drug/metabolite transporter (DMT)-like permease
MRLERTTTRRAALALIGVSAIWGFTFPAIQNALRAVDPVTFVCLRFALATLVFAVALRGRALRLPLPGLGLAAALGLCLAAGTILQTMGLRLTTAPRSAFITAMYVPLTPFMALLAARIRPRPGSVVAVGLAVAGLYLLTEPGTSGMNTGDWLTLACAVMWAAHIVVAQAAVARYDPVPVTFWQVAISALLCALALGLQGEARFGVTPWSLTALGVTAVLATAFAFWVQMWAQRETSATHAAVIFAAEPAFAAVFSFFLLGEVMGPAAFLGAALILAGMLLTQLGAQQRGGEEAEEVLAAAAVEEAG